MPGRATFLAPCRGYLNCGATCAGRCRGMIVPAFRAADIRCGVLRTGRQLQVIYDFIDIGLGAEVNLHTCKIEKK
jgi:hypothetical protein